MFRATLRERRWGPTTMRVVLASGVAVASAVATMAGVAAASSAPRAAQPTTPPPPVDHHLCYTAKVARGHFNIPPSVVLANQFSPHGFRPKIGPVALHCNPVAKTIGPAGPTFPITNPAAHLLCFHITAATQPTPTVVVTNQFGAAALTPGQPNLLCLPSWKSLKGPPTQKQPQPPGISHFTCYPVTELPGLGGYKPPPGVSLQDQFTAKPVRVKVSAVPSELCLPTAKVVGKKVFKIVNAVQHLLCFPVSQTPRRPRVWDKNQFGTAELAIGATNSLCLPSNKRVIPTPVDHHLCYVAHGQFKIPTSIRLINQFSRRGFVPKIGPVAFHCNPVAKTLPAAGQTFPITNPAAHLLCFRMSAPTQPTPVVKVTNQFGSAELTPSQPNLLCLPSWKSLTGPPKNPVVQPPGLSHFTCYPVSELPGTGGYTPPALLLQDQFAPKPVPAQVSPVPQELCLPTAKIVGTTVSKIVNPITHLLCFNVTPTPNKPRVWDQNQFGTSVIAIGRTQWLCVPSTKVVVVPPPVDHHLCYVATAKFPIPSGIELFNQFAPHGFRPKVGAVALHCNPVVKTVLKPAQTFPITNAAAHLLCFRMTAPTQPTHQVQVTNQFGTGTLITGQPNLLCLPTWKNLKKPPNMTVPQPPGLSHFTCYSVQEAGTAGYNPPPLTLQDQFAGKPVQVQVGSVPQELCLPTKKMVGKKVFPIVNAAAHLLCFPVSPTPIIPRVFDQNQFGTEVVRILRTRLLCLPSIKQVIK